MVKLLWFLEALYWGLALFWAVLEWLAWRDRRWLRKHARGDA